MTATGADANNYVVPLASGAYQRDDVFVSKPDHQFFPWLHSAASYTHYGSAQVVFLRAALSPIASGGSLYLRKVDSTTFKTVVTPNAKTVIAARFGFNRFPQTEAVGFDTTIASPLAAYKTGTVEGLLYAGLDGKTECCDLSKKKFAPKLGFAYAVTPKTVVHGGFGLLYLPMRYDSTAALNIGYTSETPIVSTNNGGQTVAPGWNFSNPFSSGPIAPTGNTAGLLSGIGTPIQAIQLDFKSPLISQFSIGVPRTLPWGVLFEGSCIGSRGRHLPTTPQGAGTSTAGGGKTNIDQLNPSCYSMGVAALSATTANPFYGHGGVGTIGGTTVSQAQLLLPFPQFTSVNLIPDYASSSYNGMALQVTKRAAKKFDLSANFTWARNQDSEYGIGSVGPQNVYNLAGEWSQSALDLPFRYTANGDYWLPVGRGGALLGNVNRWVDLAVGGWQVDVTNVIQSGLTLGVTQSNQNALIGTNVQRPISTLSLREERGHQVRQVDAVCESGGLYHGWCAAVR